MDPYRKEAFDKGLALALGKEPEGQSLAIRQAVDLGDGVAAVVCFVSYEHERLLRAEKVIEELLRTRAPSIRMEKGPRGWEALCVAELELKRALEYAATAGVEIRWAGTKREIQP